MGKKGKKKIRILIIDDHPLFREGLKSILSWDSNFEVSGDEGNPSVEYKNYVTRFIGKAAVAELRVLQNKGVNNF